MLRSVRQMRDQIVAGVASEAQGNLTSSPLPPQRQSPLSAWEEVAWTPSVLPQTSEYQRLQQAIDMSLQDIPPSPPTAVTQTWEDQQLQQAVNAPIEGSAFSSPEDNL